MRPRLAHAPAVLVLAAGLASIACATPAAAGPRSTPLPGALAARCPKSPPEALPGDSLTGATRAALEESSSIYPGIDRQGEKATRAVLARFDPQRGGFSRKCGPQVHTRTVVVYLEFPAMRPSSSLSQGVVLVARFRGSYRVWAVLH